MAPAVRKGLVAMVVELGDGDKVKDKEVLSAARVAAS